MSRVDLLLFILHARSVQVSLPADESSKVHLRSEELIAATNEQVRTRRALERFVANLEHRQGRRPDFSQYHDERGRAQGRAQRPAPATDVPPTPLTREPSPPKHKVSLAEAIKAFHAEAERAFASLQTIQRFPELPDFRCRKLACHQTSGDRVLPACPCLMRRTFQGLTPGELKRYRALWHPDCFAKCPESVRAELQWKSQVVFQTVNAMYEEQKQATEQRG